MSDPFSAISTALSIALALFIVSSYVIFLPATFAHYFHNLWKTNRSDARSMGEPMTENRRDAPDRAAPANRRNVSLAQLGGIKRQNFLLSFHRYT